MKYDLNEKHNDEKFNVSFEKYQYKIKLKAWTKTLNAAVFGVFLNLFPETKDSCFQKKKSSYYDFYLYKGMLYFVLKFFKGYFLQAVAFYVLVNGGTQFDLI